MLLGRRRIASQAATAFLFLVAGFGSACAQFRPIDYMIPQATLAAQIAKRFPHTQPVAGELVTLELRNPRLSLRPDANQIATELDLKLAAPALGVASNGALAVDFGLRFEPSDRTVRMTHPKVRSVRLDGVPAQYQSWLDRNAPRLAENLLDDYTLHQFSEREMAAVQAFGYEPAAIKVVAGGLKVTLNPKKP